MNAHYADGVNNYLNSSNNTKYLAEQSAADFFAFWKIFATNLLILLCHLPAELRNV